LEKETDVEHLAALKSYLEKRLKSLEEKVTLYRGYIQAIDSVLTRTSFKVAADLLKEGKPEVEEKEQEQTTSKAATPERTDLMSRADGTRLGEMITTSTAITIVPAEGLKIQADSGTLNSFFIKKILNGMIDKDDELIKAGKISPKEKMSYKVTKNSDGTVKQILVTNFREDSRQRQILTTIRWTLEKMTQKPA
jgi:hypothetical protein